MISSEKEQAEANIYNEGYNIYEGCYIRKYYRVVHKHMNKFSNIHK